MERKVAGVPYSRLSKEEKEAVAGFLKWLKSLPGLQEEKIKFLLEAGRMGRRRISEYTAICGHRVLMDQEVVAGKIERGAKFPLYPVCYRCVLQAIRYVSKFPGAPQPSTTCQWSDEPLFRDRNEWFANLAGVVRALIFKWVSLDKLEFRRALDLYDNFVKSSEAQDIRTKYFQEIANIQANVRDLKEAAKEIKKIYRKASKQLKTVAEKAGIPKEKIDQLVDRLLPVPGNQKSQGGV